MSIIKKMNPAELRTVPTVVSMLLVLSHFPDDIREAIIATET